MIRKKSLSPANFKLRTKSESLGKKRNWQDVIKKIKFAPSAEDLDKNNVLRPSDSFLRLLISILANKGSNLHINLPEMLIQDTGDYIQTIMEDGQSSDNINKIGKLRYRSGVAFDTFMNEVEATNHSFLEQLRGRQDLFRFYTHRIFNETGSPNPIPYLIYKDTDTQQKTILKMQPYEGYRRMKKRIDGSRLIRRYIYPRGSTTSIIRYCFRPRKTQTSQAYLLRNSRSIHDPNNQLKRTSIKLKDIWLVDKQSENSFDVFPIKSQGSSMWVQCNHLVEFLERALHIRIDLIVTNWVQDTNQITWFIKLQYVKFENLAIPGKIQIQSFACSVCCRLCGERFRKEQAQMTVTYKLIEELLLHLKQRGRKCSLSISSSLVQSCKVCDLCYMLILSEYELINVEKEFNNACGIPVGSLLRRVCINNTPTIRPSQVPLRLHQWRLFFYLNELIGLQPLPQIDLTLSLRIHNRTTYFRIGQVAQTNFKVNKIRIHYLFSEEPSIVKFQSETQIFLRLIHTKDKNQSVAQGSFSSLHFTKPEVQRRSQQVLLFYENSKYCEIQLKIGLVCDGIYDTSTLNLHEHCGAYLTDQSYTNSNCLPVEWMEIFDMDYSANRSEDPSTQLQDDDAHRILAERLHKGIAFE